MAEFKVACPCTDETQFPYLDSSNRRSEFKLRDVESLVFLPVSQTDLVSVVTSPAWPVVLIVSYSALAPTTLRTKYPMKFDEVKVISSS